MKAEKAHSFVSFTFGLVLLFVIISIIVLASSPEPRTPRQQQVVAQTHEAILYFFDAESMAKQLFPDPSFRWSHILMDAQTKCGPLGNDVWCAAGTIEGQIDNKPAHSRWLVCFLPEGRVPLYIQVGNLTSGDARAAFRRAGYSGANAQGAPGEK